MLSFVYDDKSGLAHSDVNQPLIQDICRRWGFPLVSDVMSGLVLTLEQGKLVLKQLDEPKLGAVFVDFASDALTFRRLHGGGKKEAIAKAVGLKGNDTLRVVDATAGLGRDAFVLAALGCKVTMIERATPVAALLEDGLRRASFDDELSTWVPERMTLKHGVAASVLNDWQGTRPDVVYLDPMFPHRKKSALVKKEMRLFQQLLGPDIDADDLLTPALALAEKRVVVKRPDIAGHLLEHEPNMMIKGKKHRFDVYFTHL